MFIFVLCWKKNMLPKIGLDYLDFKQFIMEIIESLNHFVLLFEIGLGSEEHQVYYKTLHNKFLHHIQIINIFKHVIF